MPKKPTVPGVSSSLYTALYGSPLNVPTKSASKPPPKISAIGKRSGMTSNPMSVLRGSKKKGF